MSDICTAHFSRIYVHVYPWSCYSVNRILRIQNVTWQQVWCIYCKMTQVHWARRHGNWFEFQVAKVLFKIPSQGHTYTECCSLQGDLSGTHRRIHLLFSAYPHEIDHTFAGISWLSWSGSGLKALISHMLSRIYCLTATPSPLELQELGWQHRIQLC